MWIVAKVKTKEINIFKKKLLEKLGQETKFYYPKIEYQKYFKDKVSKKEMPILGNYIFCYNKKFNNINSIFSLSFIKGLVYFLKGHERAQGEIQNFINYCQSFENKKGYLEQTFFKSTIVKNGKFISGPFTDMIFEIIEVQKNKLKILIGNIVTTISDNNNNYLYRPI